MFNLKIDFSQSHWFFPKIIILCMVLMLFVIVIKERNAIISSIKGFSIDKVVNKKNAKSYYFVALVCVYILAMEYLGDVFPNTGYAFLISTIPFLFIIALLVEKSVTRKKLIIISINSIFSPVMAWLILGQMFAITLP